MHQKRFSLQKEKLLRDGGLHPASASAGNYDTVLLHANTLFKILNPSSLNFGQASLSIWFLPVPAYQVGINGRPSFNRSLLFLHVEITFDALLGCLYKFFRMDAEFCHGHIFG